MIPRHKRKPLLSEQERRFQAKCRICRAYVIIAVVLGFVLGIASAKWMTECGAANPPTTRTQP
jgi:hypothetical protein